MNLSEQDIQAIVAATVAAMQQQKQTTGSDMPISNQQASRTLFIKANSQKHIPFRGSYVAVFSNTATKDVLISMDNGIGNFIKAGTGYPCVRLSSDKTTYEPAVFKRVTFENTSDEDMTIEYVLSLGPVTDTRAVIEGTLNVDFAAPILDSPVAEVVGTETAVCLTANVLIKQRVISNSGDFTLWWGDETVSAETKRGNFIYPGGSATVDCWGPVYLIAEEGGSTASINNIKGSV